MLNSKNILRQINVLTSDLIGTGLCDDQNFPILKTHSGNIEEIDIAKIYSTIFLKNIPYKEMYDVLRKFRVYNFLMIDGALILMQYKFHTGRLSSHRLSFFPSPVLYEFQNEPEIYLEDEIYADFVDKRVVIVPIRFDYEVDTKIVKPIEHPFSHLTLGQYKNCRIPVSSAITPFCFLSFIISSFYNTAYNNFKNQLSVFQEYFSDSIFIEEREFLHIHTPVIQR